MSHSPYLAAAIEAARAGEEVIRKYYQSNLAITVKADRTPVTVADVETEQAIKGVLTTAFPEHGFFGEETGRSNADSEYLWLVDPIDGTKSFVREYPFFSTQIALMHRGELVLGVSNAPMFGDGEMAYAERGYGSFLNGSRIRVSDFDALDAATLSLGNIKTLTKDESCWTRIGELIRSVSRIRGFGDFYHYHLLAAGKIELIVESDVNILDVAALSVIIGEAGGTVTQFDGRPLDLDATTIVASNGRLHGAALDAIGGCRACVS